MNGFREMRDWKRWDFRNILGLEIGVKIRKKGMLSLEEWKQDACQSLSPMLPSECLKGPFNVKLQLKRSEGLPDGRKTNGGIQSWSRVSIGAQILPGSGGGSGTESRGCSRDVSPSILASRFLSF
jgi:hypothetical protein